jgi:amino acid transporter
MLSKLRNFIFGKPLASGTEEHHKLGVILGLAVFSSDALSSTAYATEEILLALHGLNYSEIATITLVTLVAIILLIGIVVFSYRQVINAYPDGGGAYIVAKENLGKTPSLIAAASLLIDYVLTVSVSICAGVSAITATGIISPNMAVNCCIAFIILIMLVNLRGLKESGLVFSVPVYFFLISMFVIMIFGFIKLGQNNFASLNFSHQSTSNSLTQSAMLLIFLNAFSHGCSGLTGIEAVADGVRAFKAPSFKQANRTMLTMAILLSGIFGGITILSLAFGIMPQANQTVISQIAKTVYGNDSFMFFATQIATMLILVLAANTAFADFPRVANFLANDGYLPRQLSNLGDKLVFNNGIMVLSALSIFLVIIYKGNTHALIPLYAVGVFISFTLTQFGMVKRHARKKEGRWRFGLVVNCFGGIITSVVAVIITIEKLTEGAWIVLLAIPIIIRMFLAIKQHYLYFVKQIRPDEDHEAPELKSNKILIMVSSLSKGVIQSIAYAKTISNNIEALHVEVNPSATKNFQEDWKRFYPDLELTILPSPFRSLIQPISDHIEKLQEESKNQWITIVVPEFVTNKFWHNLLHNQTAFLLKAILRFRRGVVVTTVRFFLED